MKKTANKVLIVIALVTLLSILTLGCTAIDQVKKLEQKGYQKREIEFSSDFDAWEVVMEKQNEEKTMIIEEVKIIKCKTYEAAKTYKEFLEYNNSTKKTVKRIGKKVYYGTKDAVDDAIK